MKKLHGTPGPLLGGRWAGLRELRRAAPVLLVPQPPHVFRPRNPKKGFTAALKYWVGQNSHLGFTGTNFLVNPSECWPSPCVPHSLSVVSYWLPESLSSHTWVSCTRVPGPFSCFLLQACKSLICLCTVQVKSCRRALHTPWKELTRAAWEGLPGQRPPGPRAYVPTLSHSGSKGQVTPVLGCLAVVSQDGYLSRGKKKLTQPPRFWGK